MKYTYIVSWTITIMAYVPCKSVELIGNTYGGLCSETDQKLFTIGFLNRDSAVKVYKRILFDEQTTARFDSVLNK